ncbi:PR domain zinc finger protein 10 isoform X2 [Plutella xylostella]|uniref:PR domain zinc finger protein 10 isoform X2 n=1 Tax=Plutella xylostella TaxID=51655 RepID=UPI00203316F5|nr:PR domain zinc finger protein 10 isoform X2 [Plutella xylostella]
MFNTRSEKVLQAPSILSLIRANCCTTCLSSDRRLYPIKAYLPELRYLCKEVSFLVQDRICYECKAILTKTLKFRERALKAMAVISSLGQENAIQLYQEININTLSPLTCSNVKNTFDAEYDLTYNDTTDVNISPTEVKIEFDETSIKVGNEDTSDGVSDDDDREPLSGPKMEGTVDAESFLTPWRVEAVSAEYTEQEQSDDNEMPPESSRLITTEDSPKSSRKVNNSYIYSNTDQPSSSLPENEYVYDIKIFSKSEMLEYRETMKKSALYVGKSYKCEKCSISISKKELFDKHMELHDMKNGQFMCLFCEQRFPEKRTCEAHVQSHFRYYACRYCDYRHHREQQIRWHMQRNHKKFECKKCNDEFPCYNELVNHTRRAHVKKLKCDVCDKTLNSANSLKQHMQRHQGLAPVYECNVCDKKFKFRQGLTLHMKTTHYTNVSDILT